MTLYNFPDQNYLLKLTGVDVMDFEHRVEVLWHQFRDYFLYSEPWIDTDMRVVFIQAYLCRQSGNFAQSSTLWIKMKHPVAVKKAFGENNQTRGRSLRPSSLNRAVSWLKARGRGEDLEDESFPEKKRIPQNMLTARPSVARSQPNHRPDWRGRPLRACSERRVPVRAPSHRTALAGALG